MARWHQAQQQQQQQFPAAPGQAGPAGNIMMEAAGPAGPRASRFGLTIQIPSEVVTDDSMDSSRNIRASPGGHPWTQLSLDALPHLTQQQLQQLQLQQQQYSIQQLCSSLQSQHITPYWGAH